MDLVVQALWKFEATSGDPEEVAPQLGVDCHQRGECFGGRLDVGGKGVDLARAIVDESYHRNVDGCGTVRGDKCGSMALLLVAVEEGAADKSPDDGRVGTALTGAEDWEKFAVGIVVLGYAEDSFEFILGFAKGSSVNKDDVAVESVAATEYTSDGCYDAIVAGSCIIVEV
jgi:hypothetical protein